MLGVHDRLCRFCPARPLRDRRCRAGLARALMACALMLLLGIARRCRRTLRTERTQCRWPDGGHCEAQRDQRWHRRCWQHSAVLTARRDPRQTGQALRQVLLRRRPRSHACVALPVHRRCQRGMRRRHLDRAYAVLRRGLAGCRNHCCRQHRALVPARDVAALLRAPAVLRFVPSMFTQTTTGRSQYRALYQRIGQCCSS